MSENGWLLMNKDKVIAANPNSCLLLWPSLKKDELRALHVEEMNIRRWAKDRSRFSCAPYVDYFWKKLRLDFLEEKVGKFHCVSVNDTFWIKEMGSPLTWADVSPFQNPNSKTVSVYALEGILIRLDEIDFSPDVATKGSYPHTWRRREDGKLVFVKSSGLSVHGEEDGWQGAYAEYYASKICEYLGFSHMDYRLHSYLRQDGKTDLLTECDCYTDEKTGSASAADLSLWDYEEVYDFAEKSLSAADAETILDMFFLDCLLLNPDRHFNNMEFLMDNESRRVLGAVPIFDNNKAIPLSAEEADFGRGWHANDGRSFEELYLFVRGKKDYRPALMELKNLMLEEPETVGISKELLDRVNAFLQQRVSYLLQL